MRCFVTVVIVDIAMFILQAMMIMRETIMFAQDAMVVVAPNVRNNDIYNFT